METVPSPATVGRRTRQRAALVVVAIAASVLVAEGVARVVASLEPDPRVGIYRSSSIAGVGYTLAPDLDTRALGADLRTNRDGFRGPDREVRKAPGTLRIALIGDSHAFGYGVDHAASMGEVLARELGVSLRRPVEVMNFAVNGYNSLQQLAVLRHFALRHSPDVVVLVPSNNDDEPSSFASRAGYLIARPEDADLPPPPPRPRPASALAVLAERALALASRSLVRVRSAHAGSATDTDALIDATPVPAALRSAVETPLREMIRLSRRHGAAVVLAPFAGPLEWRHMLRELAGGENVPLVELLPLLHEARDWQEVLDRFGLGWDPHLGAEAHARWGDALAQVVRDRLVPPDVRASYAP